MNDYSVYKHTSPSGKVYIGTTKRQPEERWRKGFGYRGNEYFFKAINKYGWDNIHHEIIATGLSYTEAAKMEVALIASYNSSNRDCGYNIEHGGNMCGTHSEETLRKLSAAMAGNKYAAGRKMSEWHKQQLINSNLGHRRNVGMKRTPEQCANISKALTGKKKSAEHVRKMIESHKDMQGENNPMYGKKHSEHTKQLIREKATGRQITDFQRQRLRDIAIKRSVEQLDFNGNVVGKYEKVIDAAEAVGSHAQNIGFACKHPERSVRGFKWRYIDENRY
jgi:group I intron endonuclease